MIRTAEDLDAFYRKYKGGLYNTARKHLLPISRLSEIDDVVNEALLALWVARERVDHPVSYILGAVRYSAYQRTKLLSDKAAHVSIDAVALGLRDAELNPEEQMLRVERERDRQNRRAEIVNRLDPICKRDYEEWRQNGYKCPEHKHACRATKVKKQLAAIVEQHAAA